MRSMLFASLVGLISISAWAAAPEGSESKDDTFDSLAKQTLTKIESMNSILAKIKDKKSAEEVKPKFEETAKDIDDLKKRGDQLKQKLGEPSKEQKEQLEQKYKVKFDAAIKTLQAELVRVAKVEGGNEIIQDLRKCLEPFASKVKK